jgi:hypothetical protein
MRGILKELEQENEGTRRMIWTMARLLVFWHLIGPPARDSSV